MAKTQFLWEEKKSHSNKMNNNNIFNFNPKCSLKLKKNVLYDGNISDSEKFYKNDGNMCRL